MRPTMASSRQLNGNPSSTGSLIMVHVSTSCTVHFLKSLVQLDATTKNHYSGF